jgi:hypothetical protein
MTIFSNTYRAKIARIKKIPVMAEKSIKTIRKRDANQLLKAFHDGIKNDELGLERLKPETVERKARQGQPSPSTPLYGLGDIEGNRSLMNSLMVRELKNGYKVYFSKRKHHTADLTLEHLWAIHEHGCKITRGETIIVIPPRPAFKMTYSKFLNKLKTQKRERSKHVKKALTEFINTGKTTVMDSMKKVK